MLKIFSHHVPSQALAQFFIDACMLALAVVPVGNAAVGERELRMAAGGALRGGLCAGHDGAEQCLRPYRPFAGGSLRSVIERLALPVVVSVPVAYVIFQMLPWGPFTPEAAELTALAALGGDGVEGLVEPRSPGCLDGSEGPGAGGRCRRGAYRAGALGRGVRGLEVVGFVSMDPDEVPQGRPRARCAQPVAATGP